MKAGNGMRDKMERRKSGKKREDKGERGEGELPLGRQESPTRFMNLSAEKQ